MSDSVADDELAAFVDRILRMKSEEDAIKSDIKEIYAEAKGRGYDKTRLGETVSTVRKLEKDADGEAEKEAIRDLYLTAYFRAKNKPHAHAYARGGKTEPEHDRETGEITEPQVAPQPLGQVASHPEAKASEDGGTTAQAIEGPADSVTGDVSRASDGAGSVAPIQTARVMSMTGLEPREAGGLKGFGFTVSFEDRPAKQFRPLCLNRERCGASGPKECWKCLKAAGQGTAA